MNYSTWPEVTIFAFPMKMCLKMLYALFNLRYIIGILRWSVGPDLCIIMILDNTFTLYYVIWIMWIV